MADKLDSVTNSIKNKLSFDDYKVSSPNAIIPESHNDIKPEPPKDLKPEGNNSVKTESHNDSVPEYHNDIIKVKKVKRTFYILEEVAEQLDEFYAKRLGEKKKVDKSDIVTQAIKNLLQNENAEVLEF